MVSKRLGVGFVCGLLALSALTVVSCNDPSPAAEDEEAALDDGEDFDEPDDTDAANAVFVRGPDSVDPMRPVPPIQPPPHWKAQGQRPELPDSGSRPGLPTGPVDPLDAELKMREHYAVAIRPLPPFDPAGRAVDDRGRLRDLKAWRESSDAVKEALEQLVNLGSRYMDTVGADAALPSVRYQYGYALEALADKRPADAARSMRLDAVNQLKRFLSEPGVAADYVPDAELHLALALLKVGDDYGPVVDESVDHLAKAAALLTSARRPGDAGLALVYALDTLISYGRDRDAHELAQRLEAAGADYGDRTASVRRLVRRAEQFVGATMPEIEGATDVDGKPILLERLRGGPVIVHLFQSSLPTGDASADRSVETVLVPLAREFGPRGLHLVGASLDLALSSDRVAQIRANWEEWGKKGEVQDGSLDGVRDWSSSVGMDWPLQYDGKWFESAFARHLGVQESCAVLLDADGVIRWRGKPPFEGLREALLAVQQK